MGYRKTHKEYEETGEGMSVGGVDEEELRK